MTFASLSKLATESTNVVFKLFLFASPDEPVVPASKCKALPVISILDIALSRLVVLSILNDLTPVSKFTCCNLILSAAVACISSFNFLSLYACSCFTTFCVKYVSTILVLTPLILC